VIRILHGSKLSLEKDCFSLFDCLMQVQGYIADVGFYSVSVCLDPCEKPLTVNGIRVIKVLQKDIFLIGNAVDLLHKDIVLLEKFIDLPADLSKLI
jgi:hypothetical protein